MSVSERNRADRGSAGRTRSSYNRQASSAGRSGSYYRASASQTRRNYSTGPRRKKRKRRPSYDFTKIAIVGVLLIIIVLCVAIFTKGCSKSGGSAVVETTEEETTTEAQIEKNVSVDDISITGMSKTEAKEAILKKYNWNMVVKNGEESYKVPNLIETSVDKLLDEIFKGDPQETYTLNIAVDEEQLKTIASELAGKWNVKAKNGSISSYDASTDKFKFTGAEQGKELDEAKLISDIKSAVNGKQFDKTIEAVMKSVEPEFNETTAKEKYKTIGSFTTKTTSNSKRNTNVKLAASAINGTVLKPGDEFSFNKVVGERTEAKGYKPAGAYNNGEVVEEIGGGVCQVSSTLYNAVLKSGLKTTVRRSHTFEPSYVVPGTDATVSWGGPDYKFVNNSSAAIGIKASYYDQTVTISIYGIPVLEEGVSYKLDSKKVKDMELPAPTYQEDGTLQPGVEKTKSSGSTGSYWETKLIVTKNGEVVSNKIDHTTTYKGHPPVILRNTSGKVQGSTETSVVPSTPAQEGAGDGFTNSPAETTSAAPSSPGDVITSQKSTETKTTETKQTEAKPVEAKPSETKQTEAKPSETKPVEAKPTETKPAETKPAETKITETPAETVQENIIPPHPMGDDGDNQHGPGM